MKLYQLTHLMKQIFVALLLVFATFGAWADQNLWGLIWASHDQAKSLNYSGLLVTESGKHSQASRLLHQATGGSEFEVLERLDGQPAKWIRHNDQIQCIIPDRKMILTDRRHTSVSFPRVLAEGNGLPTLERFYRIGELPSQRVAGRAVRVLKLSPVDDMRYEYRLYLDRETKLLLRSELYSSEGEVLEYVGFKEISFEPTLIEKPALMSAGPGWLSSSTNVRSVAADELSYTLPDMLSGFKKSDTVCREKGGDDQVHQTVYSDGLSTLSVFIQKHQPNQSMPQAPMRHGAVMSKSQVQGDHLVTVLGEVPEKTLRHFLKSVRWKSK